MADESDPDVTIEMNGSTRVDGGPSMYHRERLRITPNGVQVEISGHGTDAKPRSLPAYGRQVRGYELEKLQLKRETAFRQRPIVPRLKPDHQPVPPFVADPQIVCPVCGDDDALRDDCDHCRGMGYVAADDQD